MDLIESKITFEIPTNIDFETISLTNNFTVLLTEINSVNEKKIIDIRGGDTNNNNNNFIGDVWVGIILTIMITSSVFCMCSCFLYHKYRQWKMNAHNTRLQNSEQGRVSITETESLPSYTIVSGLPSYDDALDQFRHNNSSNHLLPRPSIVKLFAFSPECSIDVRNQTSKDIDSAVPSYDEAVNRSFQVKELLSIPSYEEALLTEHKINSDEIEFIPQTSEENVCLACGSNKVKSNHGFPWIHSKFSMEEPKKSNIFLSSTSFSSLDELLKRKQNESPRQKSLSLNFHNIDSLNYS